MGTLAASDMEVVCATGPGAPTLHARSGIEDGEMRRFHLIRAVDLVLGEVVVRLLAAPSLAPTR